jgi:hypothetical protein
MVEIVNPQDLHARATAAMAQCGSCDLGLMLGGCTCSGEDPRHVIVDLVRELEKFQTNAALLSASTLGEAYDRLEQLLAAERELTATRAELDEVRRTLRVVRTVCEADSHTQCAKDVLRLIPPRLLAAPAAAPQPDEDAEDAPCKTCGKPWRNKRHQCAGADDGEREMVVEARALLLRAREIALMVPGVRPGSPYVQSVDEWLEKADSADASVQAIRRQVAEEIIAAIQAESMNDDEAAGVHVVRRWLEEKP